MSENQHALVTGRFAPSITGAAHPGTLLAALLAWLDVRAQGGRFVLRFEDLDMQRCSPGLATEMLAALQWLGVDWDVLESQQQQTQRYEQALDVLAATGRLYACNCSRSSLKQDSQRAPDGSMIYPGTCRDQVLGPADWRDSTYQLRINLSGISVTLHDESGIDLSHIPSAVMGDPILRRRDGAYAYQLVVVVDDAAQGVTRVVRGADLMHSTATQCALQELLGYARPAYRHHLLLLEQKADNNSAGKNSEDTANEKAVAKLAKLHGSMSWRTLAEQYSASQFIGFLAAELGLSAQAQAGCTAQDLIADFAWSRVAQADRLLLWRDQQLHFQPLDEDNGSGKNEHSNYGR